MSEWIKCSDRLPELNQVVALANDDRWMNSMAHDKQGLNWYGAGYLADACSCNQYWNIIGETRSQCLDAVTHWMEIPLVRDLSKEEDQ